jgi:hypothetical protein
LSGTFAGEIFLTSCLSQTKYTGEFFAMPCTLIIKITKIAMGEMNFQHHFQMNLGGFVVI